MRRLDLTENEPPRPFELSSDEAEALASAELAVVTRTPGSSTWEVAAGRKVEHGAAFRHEVRESLDPGRSDGGPLRLARWQLHRASAIDLKIRKERRHYTG